MHFVAPVGTDADLVTHFANAKTPGDEVEHQKEFQMAVTGVWVKRNGQRLIRAYSGTLMR
jgi:hypothetical protein